MTWAYLIIFNDRLGSREEVIEFLDSAPEVTYWYSCMPMCLFFTSTLTAAQMARRVRKRFGSDAGQRFLVSEVHEDRQGWLPKKAWHLFRHPNSPRLED